MKLLDIYNQYPTKTQVYLKFSNNNDRLITPGDMDPNSKFVRASKRRLGEDFVFDGVIQGDVIIHGTSAQFQSTKCDGHLYRTVTKGKTDYFLFIITNDEYKFLESLKKKSYKIVRQNSNRQLTLNSITEPNKDREISLVGTYDNGEYYFMMKSPLFSVPIYESTHIPYNQRDYVGQYLGVIYGLKTALKYAAGKIDVVKIYRESNLKYSDGVYKLPLKKWKPFNTECQSYANEMIRLKEELAKVGISVVFKV